jgi:hypothetical protein
MGAWFDGPTMLGWSDPHPGRWYVCNRAGCPNADPDRPTWSEAVPECHGRRMALAPVQPGRDIGESA